jgi:hypothetical protein
MVAAQLPLPIHAPAGADLQQALRFRAGTVADRAGDLQAVVYDFSHQMSTLEGARLLTTLDDLMDRLEGLREDILDRPARRK